MRLCFFQGLGAEVGDIDFSLEFFVGGEHAFFQPCQRHNGIAEPAEFLWGHIALFFPEGIQNADERRALTWKIMKVEQFKSAHARRAQSGLDFILVAERLEFARSQEKFASQMSQAVRGEEIAENLEVPRLEIPGVFFNLIEV